MKTLCKLFFLAIVLASFAGCITVGIDPKRETRIRKETNSDTQLQSVLQIEKPIISVKRIGEEGLAISVEAWQQIQKRDIEVLHREKWEIEDGKALSIGLFPGYGRIVYDSYDYDMADNWGTGGACVMLPIGAAIMNCFAALPTLSGLFYVPFVEEPHDEGISQVALVGCDRFRLKRQIGETMTGHEVERYLTWATAANVSAGIDATIVATVDIPSMWFRESVVMKPQRYGQRIISLGKLTLPYTPSESTTGTVSIFIIDESGVYGSLLNQHQGMVSHFEL